MPALTWKECQWQHCVCFCVFQCISVWATLRVSLKMCVNQHLVRLLGVVSTKSLANSTFHIFPLWQVKPGKGFPPIGVLMRLFCEHVPVHSFSAFTNKCQYQGSWLNAATWYHIHRFGSVPHPKLEPKCCSHLGHLNVSSLLGPSAVSPCRVAGLPSPAAPSTHLRLLSCVGQPLIRGPAHWQRSLPVSTLTVTSRGSWVAPGDVRG